MPRPIRSNVRSTPSRLLYVIEPLEWRLLLTAFYDYDILASTGDAVGGGYTISSFNGETSINDNGRVAFVANAAGPTTGKMIVSGDTQTAPRIISFNPSSRTYDFAQITNDNLVAAGDRINSGGTLSFFLRTWDSNSPASFTTLVRNTDKDDSGIPLDIVQIPSRSNNGALSFLSFPGGTGTLTLRSAAGAIRSAGAVSGAFRSMTGDNGWTVVKTSPASGQAILAFPATGAGQSIATPANFSAVGLPGISDDGTIIAFAGNSIVDGKGIYLSHLDAGAWSTAIKVAGINNELGYDAMGNGLFLNDFDMSINSRVGVVRQEGGVPGFEGDTILLSFVGTPSAASRDNPRIAGTPLLFTANQGLWTMRINPDRALSGAAGVLWDRRTSPFPVMQIGDKIGGQVVTALSTYDPIATAARDQDGAVRTVAPGDHYVVFRATTAAGDKIVRAAQFDSDSDGLFDHWERAPAGGRIGGVDINRDGTADLNLSAMGANPMHKDLFLEIDWLKPYAAAHKDFSPQAQALTSVVNMFAAAPLPNPAGGMGVTLHVDAGAGLSQNMGAVSLQGGDQIADSATGKHLQVVYLGADGSVSFPGFTDGFGQPILTRSMESIKTTFFGSADMDARELVFRYSVFADFQGANVVGPNLTFKGSSGLAEAANFDQANDDHFIPGNDLLVTLHGIRATANRRLTLPFPGVGAPADVPQPVGWFQAQTLAHELGHTLTLHHGGNDDNTADPPTAPVKPTYKSLMNYTYQLYPDSTGGLVQTYSGAADPVYDDWSHVELGFSEYFDGVGNSLSNSSRYGVSSPQDIDPPTLDNFEQINGPLDDQAPAINIVSPADNASVPTSSTLTVDLTASDNIGLSTVMVSFDVDGDGTISADEKIVAVSTGPGTYRAIFANVSGAAGPRMLTATATDVSTFTTDQSISLNVTTGGAAPPKITASSFTFDALPHKLTFTFDQDVSASLAAADFFIRKTDGTGQITPTLLPYDSVNNRITLTLPGITPDGRYVVTLSSTGITNATGGQLDGDGNGAAGPDFDFNFFFLSGDANHDASVDFNDLVALAQHYNTPASGPALGDFNYDGNVDFNDLVTLAQHYNISLPSPGLTASGPAAPLLAATTSTPSTTRDLLSTFSKKRVVIPGPRAAALHHPEHPAPVRKIPNRYH
jgi:hypothetical protein